MKIRKAKCKGGGISVQGRRISVRAMAALRACLDIYDAKISWGNTHRGAVPRRTLLHALNTMGNQGDS